MAIFPLSAPDLWNAKPIPLGSGSNVNLRNTSMYSCGYNFRLPLRGVGPKGRRLDLEKTILFSESLLVSFWLM